MQPIIKILIEMKKKGEVDENCLYTVIFILILLISLYKVKPYISKG